MSDYISNLVGRSLDLVDVIRPRLISMFEPLPTQVDGSFFHESRQAEERNDEVESAIPRVIKRENYAYAKEDAYASEQIAPKINSNVSSEDGLLEAQESGFENQHLAEEASNPTASVYEPKNKDRRDNNLSEITRSNKMTIRNARRDERSKAIDSAIDGAYIPELPGLFKADDYFNGISDQERSQDSGGFGSPWVEAEGRKLKRRDEGPEAEYRQFEARKTSRDENISARRYLDRKNEREDLVLSLPDIEPDPVVSIRVPLRSNMQKHKVIKEDIPRSVFPYQVFGMGSRQISDPVVNVTIGRIEVKANQQLIRSSSEHAPSIAPSLDEYLKRRADGGIR